MALYIIHVSVKCIENVQKLKILKYSNSKLKKSFFFWYFRNTFYLPTRNILHTHIFLLTGTAITKYRLNLNMMQGNLSNFKTGMSEIYFMTHKDWRIKIASSVCLSIFKTGLFLVMYGRILISMRKFTVCFEPINHGPSSIIKVSGSVKIYVHTYVRTVVL